MTSAKSISSRKRKSSTAEKTTAAPEAKRPAPARPPPQIVYIIHEYTANAYDPHISKNHGVWPTLEDANNALIRIVKENYDADELSEGSAGTDADGMMYWSAEMYESQVLISIEKHKIQPVGFEQEREWDDDGPPPMFPQYQENSDSDIPYDYEEDEEEDGQGAIKEEDE